MNLTEIKNNILTTGYIDDIKIGTYFHMRYRDLYNKIINITNSLSDTYKENLLFRSRVKFIIDYDCELNNLWVDGKYLIFNRQQDKFIQTEKNSAKVYWEKFNNEIEKTEIYSLNLTIDKLKVLTNDDIFGKFKNRTINAKDPILYKSILHHSSSIDGFNLNNKKLPARIIFIRDMVADINKLKCSECSINFTTFNHTEKQFNNVCKKCYYLKDDFYPQVGFFKKKHGDQWEYYYNEDREKIKNIQVNSLKWFISKYGEVDGGVRYNEYVGKRVDNIYNLSISSYSAISQELFWGVYNKLTEDQKKNCYFKELNYEQKITIDDKSYIPDFVYKDKIIEYDGSYWHNEIKDNNRNSFYEKNGFKYLIITDKDYNRNKKNITIIDKCINFLLHEEK